MKTNNTKYKYRIAFALCLLGWALFLPVPAQDYNYNGKINVKPELSLIGDSLHIGMTVTLEGVSINSNRSLTLTPVLTDESQVMRLPPIVINGSHRHQLYRRYLALNKNKMKKVGYPVAVKSSGKQPLSYAIEVPYHASVRYERWMGDASLDLARDLCGCAGDARKISVERLVAVIVPPEDKINPLPAFIHPAMEAEKARDERADAFLDFRIGETVILPGFRKNRKELEKAENMLRELAGDKNVVIKSVRIRGYASPEGGETRNNRLSAGRANALARYLSRRVALPPDIYSVEAVGEDWKGFEELMEKSFLFGDGYRSDVLGIIRSAAAGDTKEASIKTLKGGSYDMILENIYPKLCRATCVIDYVVRALTPEETMEAYATKPQRLSLDELFRIAGAYGDSDPKSGEVFETAVRLFPEDLTANLNAAASSLFRGNTGNAKKYLDLSDPSTVEYMNNRGVYELLSGNHEDARRWLEKAREKGSKQAEHNLAELERKMAPPSH